MHKLKSVKAVPRSLYTLKLAWCDGRVDRVDMSDVIHTYKLFTPLRGNPKLFRAVRVVDGGLGIAWTRAMDYSAESLHRLADSQRQTSGETSQRAESGCEWITFDRDFARFPGLKWQRPTAPSSS